MNLDPLSQPYTHTVKDILKSYKIVMLRDPLSLKFAMSLASIFLGLAFLTTHTTPSAAHMLVLSFSLSTWGSLFLVAGVLNFVFIGSVPLPASVKVVTSLISLFLWVLLNVSAYYSPQFDALNSLLGITVILEAWILVHTLFPHYRFLRITDDLDVEKETE